MKVSVVIPAYNEQKYIGACLDSLMRQQDPPDEIIVVNNNSKDKTASIIQKYPVRIVHEKEQGMIQARNRGFNEAQFDIIARTDADTIVPPDWIKKIRKAFNNPKLIALSGPSTFYEIPSQLSDKTVLQLHRPYFILMREVLGYDCLYGPNMAIRKKIWEKAKHLVCLDDKTVHEDIDLTIHLSAFGKIKFDKSLIVDSSFRRFKKIEPYLEYPRRMASSILKHEQFTMKAQSSRLVKKIVPKSLIKEALALQKL